MSVICTDSRKMAEGTVTQHVALKSKFEKLQKATLTAEEDVRVAQKELEDSSMRLTAAKDLLRQLDPDEQAKIKVGETQLPELLDLHSLAKEKYDSAVIRFETNKRYLSIIEKKMGIEEDASRN